ncbi:MAG: hypothetical protein KGY76_02490 [Candidatus Thermoplasmatota archaeon]|nr:hypothetical protein [Candidatus Thermoplasmatota archaeon]
MLTLVLAECEIKVSPGEIDGNKSFPEMVHFPLLLTQDSGLAEERELRTIVHTIEDKVFYFGSDVKIPDDIERFKKMMLNAAKGDQPQGIRVSEEWLIETLNDQIGKKMVMTSKGEKVDPSEVFSRTEDYVVVIGGFRKGDFDHPVYRWADRKISISPRQMKPWSVTAETLVGYRYCSFE